MTHFHKTALLTLFVLEDDNTSPDLEELLDFDEHLNEKFDELLIEEMTNAEIDPINRRTKSRVLLLGISSGLSNPVERVRMGCALFRRMWRLLPDEEELL